MNPNDRTTAIPALPNPGGQTNVPGLRRLWLVEARHISGLTDPRTIAGAIECGWFLPDQGLNLTDTAVLHNWRFRSAQGSYQEKTTTTVQGIVYSQVITLVVPKDSPVTALVCYRMAGRKWLAIYTDGNGLIRLVGTPKQPLRFDQQLTIGQNERVLAFTANTRLPSIYLNSADSQLLGTYVSFETDFSLL